MWSFDVVLPHHLNCSSSFAVGSPLHYSVFHSHQNKIITSSPGVHPRVHSPSISNMAALRWVCYWGSERVTAGETNVSIETPWLHANWNIIPPIPPSSHPSRAHSPGMAAPSFSGAARFNASFHSPSSRGHHGLLPSPNSTINETVLIPEMEPIIPDLCMEQLWSETVTAGCHR